MTRDTGASPASLLAPEATGGDTAEGGFTYQDNAVVARIPWWLSRSGFTSMIREALGDAEASFFDPGFGYRREFLEAKNHRVTPSIFRQELVRFIGLAKTAPGAYLRFVLVSVELSADVERLLRALRRVRDAFPFYIDAERIQDDSFREYLRVAKSLDIGREDAQVIFDFVEVETKIDAESRGFELFRSALETEYSAVEAVGAADIRAAWERLCALVRSKRCDPLSRKQLESALWAGNLERLQPVPCVELRTETEARQPRHLPREVAFDWAEFSGGGRREYPQLEQWERVPRELEATRRWIVDNELPRLTRWDGDRRLSPALAMGARFSAVAGFKTQLAYRGEVLSSEGWGEGSDYEMSAETCGSGEADDVAILVGILRDVSAEVNAYLSSDPGLPSLRLALFGSMPLGDVRDVQRAVGLTKEALGRVVSETGASTIHLFLAVPSHFAFFLGHRPNAIAKVQCYEWLRAGVYAPSCSFNT